MSLRRATAIVRKEILHIIRDPRNLFLVTVSPAFLLFLLSYIFSFDVGQFNIAVLDLDRTSLSRLYLDSLTSDQDLILAFTVGSYEEIDPLLVSGDIDAALVIPPDSPIPSIVANRRRCRRSLTARTPLPERRLLVR